MVSLEGLNNNNNNDNYDLQMWASYFIIVGAYIIFSFVNGRIAAIFQVSPLISFLLSYMMQSLSCKPWVGYCFIKDSCKHFSVQGVKTLGNKYI